MNQKIVECLNKNNNVVFINITDIKINCITTITQRTVVRK